MDIDFSDLFAILGKLSAASFLGGCVIVLFPIVFLLLISNKGPNDRSRKPLVIVLIVLASLFAGLFLVQYLGDLILSQ